MPATSGEEPANEPVALEAYLADALRPGMGSAGNNSDDDGSDGDADEGDAALEAEFAALLRSGSGSSGSLESVSDGGEAAP
jgi:hypothetical protein